MAQKRKLTTVALLAVAVTIIIVVVLFMQSNESAYHSTQQKQGTIIYIAKDFDTDDYIIYLKLDEGYSSKEKLRQFVITSDSVLLSENGALERILSERTVGAHVEIAYVGSPEEVDDYLWAYPVVHIALLDET